MRFLSESDHFSSLSRSPWVAAALLVINHSRQFCVPLSRSLKKCWSSTDPCGSELCAACSSPLSPAVHSVLNPSPYPHTKSIEFVSETKAFLKSRQTASAAVCRSTEAIISSLKAIMWVKHDFTFVNPCWLFSIIILLLIILVMDFRTVCSIIFLGIKERLASLCCQDPPSSLSWRLGVIFAFLQSKISQLKSKTLVSMEQIKKSCLRGQEKKCTQWEAQKENKNLLIVHENGFFSVFRSQEMILCSHS